jgi:hypothetical protein
MVKQPKEPVKQDVTEPKTDSAPVKLIYNVETPSGVYTVKRPGGRVGVIHFTLVSKAMPSGQKDPETGELVTSPADQDRLEKSFMEWTEKVLPAIYVDGPTSLQDMPGEDQYALFLAMFTTVNVGGRDLFRFV